MDRKSPRRFFGATLDRPRAARGASVEVVLLEKAKGSVMRHEKATGGGAAPIEGAER
jgi:hypothetical protein